MNFIVSANTDIGTVKTTNQDSLSIKTINTMQGRMVFAILCDGMGGLEKGEVASASVVMAYNRWVENELPELCKVPLKDEIIREQWEKIARDLNEKIKVYGARQGVSLGTTLVIMLITQSRYYILNVGDSRAYELQSQVIQITNDQTFIAREVALGHMTEEQASRDERRNVLLQCIGASEDVYPEMFFGDTKENAVYMLCSDGFRHEISPEEIFEKLQPNVLFDDLAMNNNCLSLIETDKQRGERDNISIALVRTF